MPLSATIAALLLAMSVIERPPRLLWNASASVPKGLYVVHARSPRIGDMVAIRLPHSAARLAVRRSYLPDRALLLKPVAAAAGDRVCRWRTVVMINGHRRAAAGFRDSAKRSMPVWHGCRSLLHSQLFLLSHSINSFDSRYFGPINRDSVIGVARPLIVF